MTSPPTGRLAPLHFAGFRFFLGSMLLTTLGVQIQTAAVAYQIYTLTRDPLSLGLVGLAEALPFIGLALVGGHLADAKDRRLIMRVALALHFVCSVALLALSLTAPKLAGPTLKAAILVVIAGTGVARSFFQPARNALGADLVPRELYPAAVTLRTSVFQAATIAGPAIGGLLCGFVGPQGAYATAAVLALAGFALVAAITTPSVAAVQTPHAPFWSSLREGFAFLRKEDILLPALALDLFAVLFGGATALLPVFAHEILHVGAPEFGLLRAAPGAGALLMALFLTLRRPFERAGAAMLSSVALFGVCMIGFALSRSFALSLVLLAASGALDMVSVVIRGTLLQLRVPRAMLGRVSSINQIFIGSSNEVGAFESGVAARLLGVVPSVVLGGCMTLAVVATTTWRAPNLRRLTRLM